MFLTTYGFDVSVFMFGSLLTRFMRHGFDVSAFMFGSSIHSTCFITYIAYNATCTRTRITYNATCITQHPHPHNDAFMINDTCDTSSRHGEPRSFSFHLCTGNVSQCDSDNRACQVVVQRVIRNRASGHQAFFRSAFAERPRSIPAVHSNGPALRCCAQR
jgi:hypothetical protein